MVYEYAIDPKIVALWAKDRRDYIYYYEKFGIGQPRLMAEFPKLKNWRKQFRKAADAAKDGELQRLTALFNRLKETMIYRQGIAYDGTQSWLENAVCENTRYPFQAILALENPHCHIKVIPNESIDSHKKWDVNDSATPLRNAAAMAIPISALLRNSLTIIFVDPYFDPRKHRWREPLKVFLEHSIKNPRLKDKERIEVHTSTRILWEGEKTFEEVCRKKLPDCIPQNMKVKVKRWKQKDCGEKFHNRYILTDLGGVMFGTGLDTGEGSETDDVNLMKRATYELRWSQYADDSPAFDLESEFEVEGLMP